MAKAYWVLKCWSAIALMLVAQFCAAQPVKPASQILTCGDFLQDWNLKPETLKFSHCKKIKNPQVDRLEASYTVTGKDAALVERYLRKQFRMAPLRFLCCGWESVTNSKNGGNQPGYGRYIDQNDRKFEIIMASEETVQKDWQQISRFNVRVTTYLGEI
jgi:Domian of unknown function (DUF4952)